MRVCIYRCLYGEDFVVESIASILPHVDRVFMVLAPRPWGKTKGVEYQGHWVPWPEKFDDIRERVLGMKEPSVEVIDDFYPSPNGQYAHILQDLILPRFPDAIEMLIMEPDWVFTDEQAKLTIEQWNDAPRFKKLATQQVELWKTPAWRLPKREGRATPTLFRRDGYVDGGFAGTHVHNLGFCFSEPVMRWKHLTAMAFASEINDSPPNVAWLEKKWLTWHPETNNKDLEISLGSEHNIPYAEPYDVTQLPSSIRTRFGL